MDHSSLPGKLAAAFLVATAALPAHATVSKSTLSGFAIEITAQIAASPEQALIVPAGGWNPQQAFSEQASNLSLEEKAGGCLCETLPNGGSVQFTNGDFAKWPPAVDRMLTNFARI